MRRQPEASSMRLGQPFVVVLRIRHPLLEGHSDYVVFAAYPIDGTRIVIASRDNTARVWERHHPEYWWGLAWLLEFWVTLALVGLLVWSLVDDRRLRKP